MMRYVLLLLLPGDHRWKASASQVEIPLHSSRATNDFVLVLFCHIYIFCPAAMFPAPIADRVLLQSSPRQAHLGTIWPRAASRPSATLQLSVVWGSAKALALDNASAKSDVKLTPYPMGRPFYPRSNRAVYWAVYGSCRRLLCGLRCPGFYLVRNLVILQNIEKQLKK